MIAKEAGLEPMAMGIWKNSSLTPETYALEFLNIEAGITTVEAALDGARQILMEIFSEDADLLEEMRDYLWKHSVLQSTAAKEAKDPQHKFSDYLNYAELIRKFRHIVRSHFFVGGARTPCN
jgi:uncharacterized protein